MKKKLILDQCYLAIYFFFVCLAKVCLSLNVLESCSMKNPSSCHLGSLFKMPVTKRFCLYVTYRNIHAVKLGVGTLGLNVFCRLI